MYDVRYTDTARAQRDALGPAQRRDITRVESVLRSLPRSGQINDDGSYTHTTGWGLVVVIVGDEWMNTTVLSIVNLED